MVEDILDNWTSSLLRLIVERNNESASKVAVHKLLALVSATGDFIELNLDRLSQGKSINKDVVHPGAASGPARNDEPAKTVSIMQPEESPVDSGEPVRHEIGAYIGAPTLQQESPLTKKQLRDKRIMEKKQAQEGK